MLRLGHGYKKLFPEEFWPKNAASAHDFVIWRPWWNSYELIRTPAGELQSIPASAGCGINVNGKIEPLLIATEKHPREAGAILQLGRLLFTGNRILRYMNLYMVYESICQDPEVRFSAIRHSLAHSPSALTKQRTIQALMADFGQVEVNLRKHKHQVVFWRRLGELLVEVDTKLGAELRPFVQSPENLGFLGEPLTEHLARHYHPEQYERLASNNSLQARRP